MTVLLHLTLQRMPDLERPLKNKYKTEPYFWFLSVFQPSAMLIRFSYSMMVRLPGIGTHEELLRENEVYQEICASQLSKEEVPYSVKTAN